jgi:pimeloyl-ACP methyl ester carboxylesterase
MYVSQDISIHPVAVLLPGSGSDEEFVREALAAPLRAIGLDVRTPAVRPGADVVAGYRRALDRAREETAGRGGELLVGGVSLGAQVAARWAAEHRRVAGLLLALPAWTGPPGNAPAAIAAAVTAAAVRRGGTEAALRATRATTPEWLGDELARAWRRHGDALADSLDAAAVADGPTEAQLAGLRAPVALVGLRDDPVHPLDVARRWRALIPRSALVDTTLAAVGRDRHTLGRALALAWLRVLARA